MHLFFTNRDKNGLVVADITIGSLTTAVPFDATAIENALRDALNKIVLEGKIGDLEVKGTESVEIGSAQLGKNFY